jgi:multiple sugar transport system ATP-binding protein
VGTPRSLYEHPDNLFVAGFIGSPAMNFVYGTLSEENGAVHASFAGERIRVRPELVNDRPALKNYIGKQIVVGVRPESFEVEVAGPEADPERTITVDVDLIEQLGSEAYIHFTKDSPPVVTPDIRELLEDQGVPEDSLGNETKFIARVNPDRAPKVGDNIRLSIDGAKPHFFDRETGLAIR